jgi:hypothetical protein
VEFNGKMDINALIDKEFDNWKENMEIVLVVAVAVIAVTMDVRIHAQGVEIVVAKFVVHVYLKNVAVIFYFLVIIQAQVVLFGIYLVSQ